MAEMKYARELQKRLRMKSRWLSRQEKLKWNKETIQQEYDEKEMNLKNLQEEYKEYEEESYLPTVEETEIQALNLAMETIEKLSGNISHHVGDKLRERTSQILSEITGGKYQEVLMDGYDGEYRGPCRRSGTSQQRNDGTDLFCPSYGSGRTFL